MGSSELSRAAEAEWASFARHLDLAAGFWLGFLFAPSAVPVDVMRERTARILEAQGRRMVVLAPETPEELRGVLTRLLDPEALTAGCVWVEAIRVDAPGVEDGPWSRAWESLILRMNERRDVYRERLTGGLVLAAPPGVKAQVREGASDLWSVRAIVVELAAEAEIEPFPLAAPVLRGPGEPAGAVQADFALAEAERRAKRGGGAPITQAAALVRAAKELLAEGRAGGAEKAAREAARVLEGAGGMEEAEALATLAAAERAVSGSAAEVGEAQEAAEGAAEHIAKALRLAEGREDPRLLEWYALDVEIALARRERARARRWREGGVARAADRRGPCGEPHARGGSGARGGRPRRGAGDLL